MMLNRNIPFYVWPVYDWTKNFIIDDRFTDWWIEDITWTYINTSDGWTMSGPWKISKLQNSPMENMYINVLCRVSNWNNVSSTCKIRIESSIDSSQSIEMVADQLINNWFFYVRMMCYINWINVHTYNSSNLNIYANTNSLSRLIINKTNNSVVFSWDNFNGRFFSSTHSYSLPLLNKYSYTQTQPWVSIPAALSLTYKNPYPA